nr:hypothetical protein [Tanacetum cinerariifolium]
MIPRLWILDKFELHVHLFLKILLPDPALLLVFILMLKLPGLVQWEKGKVPCGIGSRVTWDGWVEGVGTVWVAADNSLSCLSIRGARGVKVRLTEEIVSVVPIVLAHGVDPVLGKEFASFALQVLIIHSLMNQLRIFTMILQTLLTHHHSPRHTLVSYVETIITTAANLSIHTFEPSRRFNYICYDDDDDYDYEESTIPLNEIISQLPPSIVITTSPPVLPIEDLEVSLIIGNEELNTIPKKKPDEFIKSSVEDHVLIPSESKDTSGSDSECILPSCDDFSPINIFKEKLVTFSNPFFNSNDDFTSSDDESLSDEDVPKDNVKIYSNPLFEFDDEYISSDVNPLFNEVLEDIEFKDSYDSNLDESTFLVTPPSDSNDDEELRIVRFNGLGHVEIVNETLYNSDEEAKAAEVRRAQEENEGSLRRRPNMSFTNRLRVMDDKPGELNQHIYCIGDEVEELTTVVFDRMTHLLSYHRLNHTRYDGTQYTYVPDILDLGVQQGVNFMSNPQTYSTAPADSFGLFGNPGDKPSTSCQNKNAIDEE